MKTYKEFMMNEGNIGKRTNLTDRGYNDYPDQIASIEQQTSNKYQAIFPADKYDQQEFGSGVFRIETPLTSKNNKEHRSICRIDVHKEKIAFVDNEHYEATDQVKWERAYKYKFLSINDKDAHYFGL